MSGFDFSKLEYLSVPVIACKGNVVTYRNQLAHKRITQPRVGNSILKYLSLPSRSAWKACAADERSTIVVLERGESLHHRGLAIRIGEDQVICLFFAELQLLLTEEQRASYLDLAPQLAAFLTACIADEPETAAETKEKSYMVDAEYRAQEIAQLFIGHDLIIGQTHFDIISLFEQMYVVLKRDLHHRGARVLYRNEVTANTKRISDCPTIPISIAKILLFSVMIARRNQVELSVLEGTDAEPVYQFSFSAFRKLPSGTYTDLSLFACKYPKRYPMLFGYMHALMTNASKLSCEVGEDGHTVVLRVKIACAAALSNQFHAPEREESAARVLAFLLRFSSPQLELL